MHTRTHTRLVRYFTSRSSIREQMNVENIGRIKMTDLSTFDGSKLNRMWCLECRRGRMRTCVCRSHSLRLENKADSRSSISTSQQLEKVGVEGLSAGAELRTRNTAWHDEQGLFTRSCHQQISVTVASDL